MRRFTSDRPNELWQPEVTHVTLTTGHDSEGIGWLDEHSRYLPRLSATATGGILADIALNPTHSYQRKNG